MGRRQVVFIERIVKETQFSFDILDGLVKQIGVGQVPMNRVRATPDRILVFLEANHIDIADDGRRGHLVIFRQYAESTHILHGRHHIQARVGIVKVLRYSFRACVNEYSTRHLFRLPCSVLYVLHTSAYH